MKIKALKSDPKSANISGTWVCNEDGNALQMTLTDTGADAVAWNLSDAGGGRQITDRSPARKRLWKAQGRDMRKASRSTNGKGRIETPDTIVVYPVGVQARDHRTKVAPA